MRARVRTPRTPAHTPSADAAVARRRRYIGCTSGWQDNAEFNENYYMAETASKWLAIPVFAQHAARAVRECCDRSCGVKYSLARYASAAWGLRQLSGLLSESLRAPAHCATLTARVLKHALGSDVLKHPSSYYGPASLFAELRDRMGDLAAAAARDEDQRESAAEQLARGAESAVLALSHEQQAGAIRALTLRVLREQSEASQKQLASALLRWSVLRAKALERGQAASPQ